MPCLIAITGGIGSGKSVVSRILSVMGYPVYDCDLRAKELMDGSSIIKRRISEEIGAWAITESNHIDRKALASAVFSDKAKLNVLNGIVHGAVRRDIDEWAAQSGSPLCWVESAIIYESGIDRMVDEVWTVEAPEELRISRVMARNLMTREDVEARIAAQSHPADRRLHHLTRRLVNDDVTALLPQVLELLARLQIEIVI